MMRPPAGERESCLLMERSGGGGCGCSCMIVFVFMLISLNSGCKRYVDCCFRFEGGGFWFACFFLFTS